MIISHKYKYIFLKTEKTAGTSIEIALSKFCGPEDIITPISAEDEEIRKELNYRGPQNYNYLCPPWDYNFKELVRFLLKGKVKYKLYNHISANKVRDHVGQEIWDSYFKFCFERNPWDKIVSLYYWLYQSEPRPNLSEFIDSNILRLKRRGFELYTINGKVVVNKICRFENLSEELETIRKQLNIPEKLNLPHAKSRFRVKKDKYSYRDYFNEKEKERIAKIFSEEIDILGYEF